jgi:dihydroorotate dehydrogenase
MSEPSVTPTPTPGPPPSVDLAVEICGIRFPNPVLTAAGPPVRDGAALLACAGGGAGGLGTKTI